MIINKRKKKIKDQRDTEKNNLIIGRGTTRRIKRRIPKHEQKNHRKKEQKIESG